MKWPWLVLAVVLIGGCIYAVLLVRGALAGVADARRGLERDRATLAEDRARLVLDREQYDRDLGLLREREIAVEQRKIELGRLEAILASREQAIGEGEQFLVGARAGIDIARDGLKQAWEVVRRSRSPNNQD